MSNLKNNKVSKKDENAPKKKLILKVDGKVVQNLKNTKSVSRTKIEEKEPVKEETTSSATESSQSGSQEDEEAPKKNLPVKEEGKLLLFQLFLLMF